MITNQETTGRVEVNAMVCARAWRMCEHTLRPLTRPVVNNRSSENGERTDPRAQSRRLPRLRSLSFLKTGEC